MTKDAGEPASRCRACDAPTFAADDQCGRCGAMQRDDIRCPHCAAHANASPHAELRVACDVCGAPRIRLARRPESTLERAVELLRQAETARRARAASRMGAALTGVAVPMVLAVAMLAFSVFNAVVFAGVVAAVAFAFAVGSFSLVRRGRTLSRAMALRIEEAWVEAGVSMVGEFGPGLDALRLSSELVISESRADELLTLLQVDGYVQRDGGNASIRARIADAADAREELVLGADADRAESTSKRAP
jgi:hypothetical protein